MQTKDKLNVLEVYRYNDKNYLTGISLLMISQEEYILSENKNMLYETPQYIIDDLYYNMPNLEVRYSSLNKEQIPTIYTSSIIPRTINNSGPSIEELDEKLEQTIESQKETIVQEILNWFKEEYKKDISSEQKIQELLKMTEPIVRQKVEERFTKIYEESNTKRTRR